MKRPIHAMIATASFLPELSSDCRLLPPALASMGWEVSVEVWDDPDVDWSQADVVVVRSIWDYFEKRAAFESWLSTLEAAAIHVENPVHVLRQNLDKRYLERLGEHGASIVPTFYSRAIEGVLSRARQNGWTEAVIKPTVNAAGKNTHRVPTNDSSRFEHALVSALKCGEVMVQKFIPNVVESGEWSLIFFDGNYSHAVRKTAAQGEFRVQDDWGGQVHFDEPPQGIIASAVRVLEAASTVFSLNTPLTYARIDGVVDSEVFLLMELELIEPELFLRADPAAPGRCAQAIAGRMPNRA